MTESNQNFRTHQRPITNNCKLQILNAMGIEGPAVCKVQLPWHAPWLPGKKHFPGCLKSSTAFQRHTLKMKGYWQVQRWCEANGLWETTSPIWSSSLQNKVTAIQGI